MCFARPLAVRFVCGQFFEGRQHRSVHEFLEKEKGATEQLLLELCLEKLLVKDSWIVSPWPFPCGL